MHFGKNGPGWQATRISTASGADSATLDGTTECTETEADREDLSFWYPKVAALAPSVNEVTGCGSRGQRNASGLGPSAAKLDMGGVTVGVRIEAYG